MDGDFGSRRDLQVAQLRLSDEELAAVEGWQRANRLDSRAEALRELVRLGLLSEIGRIYRSVTGNSRGGNGEPGNA